MKTVEYGKLNGSSLYYLYMKNFVTGLIVFSCISVAGSVVNAQDPLDKPIMQLRIDDVQIGDIEPTASPDKPPVFETLLSPQEQAAFQKNGYIIRTSYPGEFQPSSLQFSVSKSEAAFELVRTSQEASHTITVSAPSRYSYQVLAWQQQPLRTLLGDEIPATKCNGTKLPCSVTYAQEWPNTGSFGFGYRMEGASVPGDFLETDAFRPFADIKKKDPAATIMSGISVTGSQESIIRYRLIMPPSQTEGSYAGTTAIIAIPKL